MDQIEHVLHVVTSYCTMKNIDRKTRAQIETLNS